MPQRTSIISGKPSHSRASIKGKKKVVRDFLGDPGICFRSQGAYTWVWRFLKGKGGLL